jgi:hypothetical protein
MATPAASSGGSSSTVLGGQRADRGRGRRAAADHRLGHPIDRERLVLRARRAADHGDLRLVVVDDGPTGRRVGAEDVTRHPEEGIAVFVGHPQHDAALDHRLQRGGHALAAVGGEGHVDAEAATVGEHLLERAVGLGAPGHTLERGTERGEAVDEQQDARLVGAAGESAVLGEGRRARRRVRVAATVELAAERGEQAIDASVSSPEMTAPTCGSDSSMRRPPVAASNP